MAVGAHYYLSPAGSWKVKKIEKVFTSPLQLLIYYIADGLMMVENWGGGHTIKASLWTFLNTRTASMRPWWTPLKGFLSATGPLLHLLATVISFRCVVKLTTEAAWGPFLILQQCKMQDKPRILDEKAVKSINNQEERTRSSRFRPFLAIMGSISLRNLLPSWT